MAITIEEKVLSGTLLGLVLFLGGCAAAQFRCPSLGDDVTWTSYGQFSFGNAGGDPTALKIVSDCGWHVFGGHSGGLGETLEVAAAKEEVVFVWAYNNLSAFRVTYGRTGKTARGAKLGDSATAFHNLYPEFTVVNQSLSTFTSGNINVEAHFDAGGSLEEFLVGQN